MDKKLRIEKIKEIRSGKPEMTGIHLSYKGRPVKENVYRIPLEYLTYNKYNGRIGSAIKSFEKSDHELDLREEKDITIVEKFLFESNKKRNKQTEKDILRNGQQKHGIITADGIIVDGNRRASLLNKLHKEGDPKDEKTEGFKYFLAIILPEDCDKREIERLETIYQMGQDEKVDYNAIEKYLKCASLKESGFTEKEISGFFGEKENVIKDMLQTKELMDLYLEYLGYEGIYTRLEKKEDLFLNLSKILQIYNNGRGQSNWQVSDLDLEDLKIIAFDYIRLNKEGKDFRNLTRNSRETGFFCNKKVWENFREKYNKFKESVEEEISADTYRAERPGESISEVFSARDEEWTVANEKSMVDFWEGAKENQKNISESNEPIKLVERASSAIDSIDKTNNMFFEDELFKESLKKLKEEIEELIENIERGR